MFFQLKNIIFVIIIMNHCLLFTVPAMFHAKCQAEFETSHYLDLGFGINPGFWRCAFPTLP